MYCLLFSIFNNHNKQMRFLWGFYKFYLLTTPERSEDYILHAIFQADVIIWDFESQTQYCRLPLHMVKVEALAFSPNDKYLVSLGGGDDGR